MKSRFAVLCALFAITAATLAFSQASTSAKPTFASVLDQRLSQTEKTVVPAAEAMPDDKFAFAPTQGEFKGVRSFGDEVKHMAVANYALGAGILGEKRPAEAGEGPNGPDSVKSKADTIKFLKDSFVYAHKAVNSVNETNILEPIKSPFGSNMTTRLALSISIISHPYDHYGQMVEYLRMNGIVPPASRQ
jgi:hypothetical protein